LAIVCPSLILQLLITSLLYSNIVYRYEMAVGTTPGGAQIQSFTAIPAGSLYHTIGGLSMTGNTIVSNQYKY
jgi:hypothetical protein